MATRVGNASKRFPAAGRHGYISGVQDRLLATRLCAGDDSALTEVFDRFGPLVLGLARRVTGNKAMAEDVLQEVFTWLWCQPDRFDPDRGTMRAYLGVLTHRRAVDAVRSAARRQAREEKVELLDLPLTLCDHADATAVSEAVRRAIERLPVEQRRAIELAFWQGMTQHEVARALGIPEGTVKSRLRLAQAKLRDSLAPLALEGV
jgi:RNA polymerase sigma-70 factor (ECF subfamily)